MDEVEWLIALFRSEGTDGLDDLDRSTKTIIIESLEGHANDARVLDFLLHVSSDRDEFDLARIEAWRVLEVVVEAPGGDLGGTPVSDCPLAHDPLHFARQKYLAHPLKSCREREWRTCSAERGHRNAAAGRSATMALPCSGAESTTDSTASRPGT